MGFRPREPFPPEASHACLPVWDRRAQLGPALLVRPAAGPSSAKRHPLAPADCGPPGPIGPGSPAVRPYLRPARRRRGIGTTTAYRYVTEAVELLAELAPDLTTAMKTATQKAFVILDRTLLPIDRIAADRPCYSGKHKRHGKNVQVLADPHGRLLCASSALPGAVHGIRAARTHGVIDSLADAGLPCWADKGYQGAGGTVRVPFRGRWDRLSPGQQAVSRPHARM